MTTLRALHVAADKANDALDAGTITQDAWQPIVQARYDACMPLWLAAEAYADDTSTEHYDALLTVALACHATDTEVT